MNLATAHPMKTKLFAILFVLLSSCGRNTDEFPIKTYIVYDEPVNGYRVTGVFYPFDANTETGQIELRFKPIKGGRTLVYSTIGEHEEGHPEWSYYFSGKNIFDVVFDENGYVDKASGFKNGETYHWHYHGTQDEYWTHSPLLYDAEFQFYDADFDGEDELLINTYYRGQIGNYYKVYEITPQGLVLRKGKPFDDINNDTEFHPDTRTIVNWSSFYYGEKIGFTISKDGKRVMKVFKIGYDSSRD